MRLGASLVLLLLLLGPLRLGAYYGHLLTPCPDHPVAGADGAGHCPLCLPVPLPQAPWSWSPPRPRRRREGRARPHLARAQSLPPRARAPPTLPHRDSASGPRLSV